MDRGCVCLNGKVYMPALKKFVACPRCVETLTQQVKESLLLDEDMYVALRIPVEHRVSHLCLPNIRSQLSKAVQPNKAELIMSTWGLMSNMVAAGGCLMQNSLFYIQSYDYGAFVYNYLLNALNVSKSVVPYIGVHVLHDMFKVAYSGWQQGDDAKRVIEFLRDEVGSSIDYRDYLEADICCLHLTELCTRPILRVLKGFIQDRSRRGKYTVIFSDVSLRDIQHSWGYGLTELNNLADNRHKLFVYEAEELRYGRGEVPLNPDITVTESDAVLAGTTFPNTSAISSVKERYGISFGVSSVGGSIET